MFGVFLSVAVYLILTILFVIVCFLVYMRMSGLSRELFLGEKSATDAVTSFLRTRFGQLASIASLASLWVSVWASVRLIHGRPLSSVFGQDRRIDWSDFRRAFSAFALVLFVLQLTSLLFDPQIMRTTLPLAEWSIAALIAAALLFVQSSAEEAFFRGYLTQSLAARFARPVIWVLIPVAFFTLAHLGKGQPIPLAGAYFGVIAALGLAFTWLVVRTGNLGAAMGAHFGNNLVAILFVSNDSTFDKLALFGGQTIQQVGQQEGPLSIPGVLVAIIPTFAGLLFSVFLVSHPKSPFALAAFLKP